MDKFKNKYSKSCGLIFLLLSTYSFAQEVPKSLGTVTQVHGEVTYLPFNLPTQKKIIKQNDTVLPNGSYLSYEDSFLTVKLFEGNYLRLSPKSKFSLEFDPKEKNFTLHLFTGSVKVLFSQKLNQGLTQKFIIKSGDSEIEASDAKFTVVRNPVMDSISCYVEKGMAIVSQYQLTEKKDSEYVHAMEMISTQDRNPEIAPAQKMKEKELRFLHSSFYLKNSKRED